MKILYNTRAYLSCPMQYANSYEWAENAEKKLNELKVISLNPYKKNFVNGPNITDEIRAKLIEMKNSGDLGKYHEIMSEHRAHDLRCIDISDFVIVRVVQGLAQWGASAETAWADFLRKPVFLEIAGGARNAPDWLLATFKPEYFYSSFDEIFATLVQINEGFMQLSSEKWRLLIPEKRA